MKYTTLGKSDLKISVIGQGSGQFGCKDWGYGVNYDDKSISKIIQVAIESGINFFDTAENYSDGVSEKLLGQAFKTYNRDDFVVVSKVAPWNLGFNNLVKAANRSLRRLGIGTIDLYLIHYPNPLLPLRQTFRAMEHLVKTGKVRYIGVSNFNAYLVQKAQENLSSTEIVANEIEYNIFSRRVERKVIPYCRRQGIRIIAYSPLAGGLLTGRFSPSRLPNDKARAFNFFNRRSFFGKAQPLFTVLKELAEEKGASVAQIALSFIIKDPLCVAIPTALNEKEVIQNARVSELALSDKEYSRIKEAAVTVSLPTYFFDHSITRPISWTKETIRCTVLQKMKIF
jgi:aryl-alcohol dehydrogenase-like predicted oxidoreductase